MELFQSLKCCTSEMTHETRSEYQARHLSLLVDADGMLEIRQFGRQQGRSENAEAGICHQQYGGFLECGQKGCRSSGQGSQECHRRVSRCRRDAHESAPYCR